MIGQLRGLLLSKTPPQVLIDVQGVGYELEVPMSTFYELPATGSELVLIVHMLVREDAQLLYGFATQKERMLFRALLKVSGVGAKVALGILSGMSADEFALCIERKDVSALIRLPGIGKKTAERLIIEMSDKVAQLAEVLPASSENSSRQQKISLQTTTPRSQAIEALVALGYKPAEATRMADRVELDESTATVESIIRLALKAVTGKGVAS